MPTAKFSVRPGFVFFSSDTPGNHATMFGPQGEKLLFRGDISHFSDAARTYTWAFEHGTTLAGGDEFVFATSDRSVVGVVKNGEIEVVQKSVMLSREFDGKPVMRIAESRII